MNKLVRYFRNVPLRWRLTFSSSVLMFITFLVFSFVQYELLYSWLLSQEKEAVLKTKEEVAAYYEQANRPFQEINRNDMETLLLKLNDRHQLIRILDIHQDLMISVSNEFPKKLSIANYPSREGIEELRIDGEHYIVTWEHIQTRTFQGTVEVVRNLTTFHEVTKIIFFITIGFAIATLIISVLSGILISRQYITPLKELNHAMIKIKDEGFQTRVKEMKLHDEVTELTRIFNGMMDTVEDTINQQKQFIEDASHELRTPIAVLEGHLSMLNRWGKNDAAVLDESLEASMQEVTRLRKLVLELLELTRSETITPSDAEPIIVSEIIEQLTKNVAVLHPKFELTFKDITTEQARVSISRHHLEQIIMILLDNAVKYSGSNKTIDVLVANRNHEVIIEVKDNGIGIPSEELDKVFNRFYRVDKARSREGGGTGLGLAIAKRLVEKYNGEITVTSQEQKGTTFEIKLKT
ncbi:HAMP domain-containing histidine kinase [Bacillus sp. BGMRC 2118]|nr:HAMP domain-containing histidine kinase [Bacillus sp. BGMRC 2118]